MAYTVVIIILIIVIDKDGLYSASSSHFTKMKPNILDNNALVTSCGCRISVESSHPSKTAAILGAHIKNQNIY